MNIKEWLADNVVYRFFGCFYSNSHDHIFDFIESKTPKIFLGKTISDLGCGDGLNTLRVKKVFKAKDIVGLDRSGYLVKKAKEKGLNVKKVNLDEKVPKGELASFIFSLHHIKNKEKVLRKVKNNFNYIFLCEPVNDLYHRIFDAGTPLSKEGWVRLFDKVLGKYELYQYRNNLIVFYKRN